MITIEKDEKRAISIALFIVTANFNTDIMNKNIYQYMLILLLILQLSLASFGQSIKVDTFKITHFTREINDIKVIISQYKSLIKSPETPYCKADIKILRNDKPIDSIKFSDIEPVGGHYGLLIYSRLIKTHLIISKYGDYDGKTIIINSKGQKYSTIGGYCYIDKSNGLLFSIYDSDLSGFSVFNLDTDEEIFKLSEIDDEPLEFYKTLNDQYFFKAYNHVTGKDAFWNIDLKMKKIKKINIEMSSVKSNMLEALADYKLIDVHCE